MVFGLYTEVMVFYFRLWFLGVYTNTWFFTDVYITCAAVWIPDQMQTTATNLPLYSPFTSGLPGMQVLAMDMAIQEPADLSFDEYRKWSRARITELTGSNQKLMQQLARTRILLDSSYDAVMALMRQGSSEDQHGSTAALQRLKDIIETQPADEETGFDAVMKMRDAM